ncbi:bacterial extracellular solute-binding s, 5 Middle family protein, partial [Chlamydia psittaci 09DC78]
PGNSSNKCIAIRNYLRKTYSPLFRDSCLSDFLPCT